MNLKAFSKASFLFYRYVLRRLRSAHATQVKLCKRPSQEKLSSQVLVCDVEGGLLRSSSTFPYFMLVALEGGEFLRGLLLLLLYPLICLVSHEVGLRLMVMVAFCGLKKDGFRVGRAVLPKFFLEDVGLEGFEVLRRGGKRMCVSSMPRVMVEGFLKEYLEVEVVLGRELKELGGYYTGLMEKESQAWEGMNSKELFGGEGEMKAGAIGFGSYLSSHHHRLFSHCKEVYLVSEAEKRRWHPLPRSAYPKPLIFHDGRIAFRPTPISTLCMFLWLPLGILLAIFRAVTFIFLPFAISTPILAFVGMYCRITTTTSSSSPPRELEHSRKSHGQIYVCNHRTLLDPLYISAMLKRHVTATTYSISRVSEFLSPIKTIRLTRNREADRARMESVLREGDLVVCPEGTTCREPYLLRFSPLFAELISQEVVPVALKAHVDMFHGTTASGFKGLDPLYFLMNPYPWYELVFKEKVSTSSINGRECSSREVANYVQEKMGKALGFECTALTRRDKYLMLAGNEGLIDREAKGS
ncbi:probable glycerol-3-phosphate acyltransferase 3 [Phoenix dactylifera]|uniref:Probable glycerol-3-phosphate acyltransferase 3 n=1 Tax=Phoenix dactylifera TaxID=42345 RepID=A0A8B7CYF1_PHODC|nr:probable glycerol-3-phosphate acyltransferase 3 [Phoenix dactylifera]